ncbi:MAG: hypothetical protein KDA85_15545, partial [Planctomycetaceae bacterium]|nr:hypothetical protein [Planctomycetaceae bacterium]
MTDRTPVPDGATVPPEFSTHLALPAGHAFPAAPAGFPDLIESLETSSRKPASVRIIGTTDQ